LPGFCISGFETRSYANSELVIRLFIRKLFFFLVTLDLQKFLKNRSQALNISEVSMQKVGLHTVAHFVSIFYLRRSQYLDYMGVE
jgi:hypothetical protein